MIFKDNAKLNDGELYFLEALAHKESLEGLIVELSDYTELVLEDMDSVERRLAPSKTLEDFVAKSRKLKNAIKNKIEQVKAQRYEEAAVFRGEEMDAYNEINLGIMFLGDEGKEGRESSQTAIDKYRAFLKYRQTVVPQASDMSLFIQPGTASKEDISELLMELSKLYRMIGGSGINFKLDGVANPKFEFGHE